MFSSHMIFSLERAAVRWLLQGILNSLQRHNFQMNDFVYYIPFPNALSLLKIKWFKQYVYCVRMHVNSSTTSFGARQGNILGMSPEVRRQSL